MSKETGGPAFPTMNEHQNSPNTYHFEGMTMRDYFAAKAMQGYVACGGMTQPCDGAVRPFNESEIAAGAYAVADAMLAERSK